jgi:hypothetical protein
MFRMPRSMILGPMAYMNPEMCTAQDGPAGATATPQLLPSAAGTLFGTAAAGGSAAEGTILQLTGAPTFKQLPAAAGSASQKHVPPPATL